MTQILVKFAKRIAVFVPGIIIVYLSFRYTLPFFDKRLPDALSILATYALGAYILVPGLIRFWRIVWPPRHLPLYCVTPDGFASDPLNLGIVCTRRELIGAMEKAGWFRADPHTLRNTVRNVLSIILGLDYPTAPVSKLYMFGRKQDLAFEIPIDGNNVNRHHVRFWATTFNPDKPFNARNIHWHHRKAHIRANQLLWVGSASLDTGIRPIRHNMQLTHMVHPDTNKERQLIVSQLNSLKLIDKTDNIKLGNPYKLVNRTWRGELHTDGMMCVMWFKQKQLTT